MGAIIPFITASGAHLVGIPGSQLFGSGLPLETVATETFGTSPRRSATVDRFQQKPRQATDVTWGPIGPSSHTETEVNGELWVGSLGSFGVPSSYLQKVKVFGRVGVTSISS